jgi:hypothetical protein
MTAGAKVTKPKRVKTPDSLPDASPAGRKLLLCRRRHEKLQEPCKCAQWKVQVEASLMLAVYSCNLLVR